MDSKQWIDTLDGMDKAATLWLNHDGGMLQDWLWSLMSSRMVWLPVALLYLFLLARRGHGWRTVAMGVMGMALTVALCDQLSASVCKPLFMRLRPSHDPEVSALLHYVGDYRGGLHGFVSSHAANAFGALAYAALSVRRRWFTLPLLLMACMVGYSRIYLGVHFLGDVLCGAMLGLAVGCAAYFAMSHAARWMGSNAPTPRQQCATWTMDHMRGYLARALGLTLASAIAIVPAMAAQPADSLATTQVSHADTTHIGGVGRAMDCMGSSRLYQMTYIGVPLIVGGLIAKGEDTHFRNLRNDYMPQFRRHLDDYMQYAPAAVMLGMKAAGVESRSSWGRMLASDAFSAAIMAGVVNTLKTTTKVERPDGSNRHSFPSGHTATAFMAATMLTKEYGHKSPWIGIGAYSVASATGLMRMANNKHWLSDVLTGAGIGILSTELGYYVADLLFRDRGINHFGGQYAFSRWDKPSFVSLYLGMNIPLSSYDIDEQNEFRTSSGSVAGVEGAYFINPYIGLGGRVTASNIAIITNGDEAENNSFDAVAMQAGAYFSYPLSTRWLVGSKLLGGYVYYPTLRLANTTIDSRGGATFGSGLSLSFKATKNYSMRFFADYNLSPSHSRATREWMSTLTVGMGFGISL